LGKLMLEPRNVLVLDEPTNHLDIPACEVLEEALCDFDGTLIVVSHDRYFLDRVCTKLVSVRDGHAELFSGNYSDQRRARNAPRKDAQKEPPKKAAPPAPRQEAARKEPQ